MPRLSTPALLLFFLATPVFATESPSRNAAPVPAAPAGDAAELAEFESMVAALCDAYEDRMPGRYHEINDRLQRAMAREIDQARVARDRAVNEERRARQERRGEPMRAGTTAAPGLPAGDTHDAVTDRRGRRSAFNRCEEMTRIGTLSGALQNEIAHGHRPAMARNIELAGSFLGLMRADARTR